MSTLFRRDTPRMFALRCSIFPQKKDSEKLYLVCHMLLPSRLCSAKRWGENQKGCPLFWTTARQGYEKKRKTSSAKSIQETSKISDGVKSGIKDTASAEKTEWDEGSDWAGQVFKSRIQHIKLLQKDGDKKSSMAKAHAKHSASLEKKKR